MNTVTQVIDLCLERLASLYGTNVRLDASRQQGGGCINNALVIDCNVGRFFLKWNASCAPDMFLKEAKGLQEMYEVGKTYLIIPKVIWAKEPDEMPGLLLMEYLEPAPAASDMDELLGRGLALLHGKLADEYGFYHDNYCGATTQKNEWTKCWIDFFGQQRLAYLLSLIAESRGLPPADLRLFDSLIARLPQLLQHETKPSLIHGDLWSGNYLYSTAGPALIDPACSYSDREMELAMMTLFGGFSPRVWEAYQEMFPLPDGWKERNQLYQLYHILNHYYLFGGSYLSQARQIAQQFL